MNPFADLEKWWRRNCTLHGAEFIALVALVYFMQGARGYVDTTIIWILDNKVDSDTVTQVQAVGKFPWNTKFLYGLISDNLPVLGYHVKPYFGFFLILGIFTFPMIGIEALTPNYISVAVAYTLMQWYGAVSDVLADSLVVRNGRSDQDDASSSLQSVSWFALGLGGFIFSTIGGYMSTEWDAAGLESTINHGGARKFNLILTALPVLLLLLVLRLKEPKSPLKPSFKRLGQQIIRLFVAFFSPPFLVLRVALWITLSNMSYFIYSSAVAGYVTKVLKVTPFTQSLLDSTAYIFLAIGVVIYYRFFRHTSFRKIFFVSQLLYGGISMCEWVLITRQYEKIHCPVVVFMFCSNVVAEIVGRLNAMPFLVMAAQMCPIGMEATFFALLMSISNGGSNLGTIFASSILNHYNISSKTNQFENLDTAILIRTAAVLGVLVFIFLVPNTSALHPTNLESLKPKSPLLIKIITFAGLYEVDENGVGRVIQFGEEEKRAAAVDEKKVEEGRVVPFGDEEKRASAIGEKTDEENFTGLCEIDEDGVGKVIQFGEEDTVVEEKTPVEVS